VAVFLGLSFLELAGLVALIDGARYLLLATAGWFLVHRVGNWRWPHRKIVPAPPRGADVRRELLASGRTVLVFGVVGACVFSLAQRGCTRMYFDLHEHGTAWFVASIALTILLHDTWFYWTHRAMHHPRLFRFVHRTHHLSKNPTAFAAYSFSVPEAVVQAGIFPLVAFTIPIHPLAFAVFMLWQVGENVLGHAGHEIFPGWLLRTPLGVMTNTPTHHVLHHERFTGNYGLYFNWWDRLMGTNHPDYVRRFEAVTRYRGTALAGAAARPDRSDAAPT
jgi:sterol desaturase/sphingolipid hydroxylase (fatty acid hydroxylase superfamily)